MSKTLIMQLDCVRNPWKDDVTSASGLGQGSWREMPTWSLRAWTSPCPEPLCPFLKMGNRGTWGEHAERLDSRDPFIQILAYFQRRAACLPPEDGSHHQTASECGGRGGCGKRGQQHVGHVRWAPRGQAVGAHPCSATERHLVPPKLRSILTPTALRYTRKQASCLPAWETDTTQNGNKETADHRDKKADGREVRGGDHFETGGQGGLLRSYLQART